MKLHLTEATDSNTIRRFTNGVITIKDQTYARNLIAFADRIIDDFPPITATELTLKHLRVVIDYQPELIVLGTGLKQHFPDPSLVASLGQKKIGIEAMNTSAACRTFNILICDGRNVAGVFFL